MKGMNDCMAALDWLTVTTSNQAVGFQWYEVFKEHRKRGIFSGMDVQDWRNRWYTGVSCGGVAWGAGNKGGYILIARGAEAQEYWQRVAPVASRVTRVDVQVTVRLENANPEMAKHVYEKAKTIRARNYTHVQNSRDGNTVYVGSRNSDQYGRMYDKGVQSGTEKAGILWRYEVEVKKPRSDVFMSELYNRALAGYPEAKAMAAYVHNWFAARGIEPLFRISEDSVIAAAVGKRVTTADKKLAWLRSQVRPSFQELLREGFGQDALISLGIDAEQLRSMQGLLEGFTQE